MVVKSISMTDEMYDYVRETGDGNFSERVRELMEKGRAVEEGNE